MLALGFYLVIKGESPFETAVRTVLCPMVPTGSACEQCLDASSACTDRAYAAAPACAALDRCLVASTCAQKN